ncbi:hypothetical protein ACZ87_03793, partial [Candidatus Erwinia dacicola]
MYLLVFIYVHSNNGDRQTTDEKKRKALAAGRW